MPAARYWRAVGIETYGGGDLELSELQLYGSAGRLDTTATLTASVSPSAGSLANLSDADTGTTCTFSASAIRAPGFALQWDFGVAGTADVWGLRIGSATSQSKFLQTCDLQYLSGGVWVSAQLGRYAWPGANSYTPVPSGAAVFGIGLGGTRLDNAGVRTWGPSAIARSAYSLVSAVAFNGFIYTSTDGGNTWVTRSGAGSLSWSGVSISADGLKIAAAPYGGVIRTSTDGGATWVSQSGSGSRNWLSLAASADGSKLVAGEEGGNIYTSSDGGVTWVARPGAGVKAWRSVAMSPDGQQIAAAPNNGSSNIQVSNDGGVTWSAKTAAGSTAWAGVVISANGQKILASSQSYLALSSDGGTSWATVSIPEVSGRPVGLGVSDDGQTLWVAMPYAPLWFSTDGGATWRQMSDTGSGNWRQLGVTADGTLAVCAGQGGHVYIARLRSTEFSPPLLFAKQSASADPFWREDITGSVGISGTNTTAPVRDIYTAGRGQIVATVKEDGTPDDTPVRRKVRLFRDRDGLLVRETWSDATTGVYSFTEIDENETYSVVSYDYNNNFRAVIADNLTPEVAP